MGRSTQIKTVSSRLKSGLIAAVFMSVQLLVPALAVQSAAAASGGTASVELVKKLNPSNDPGLFNLSLDGPNNSDTTTVNNQSDGGTTGKQTYTWSGNKSATLSETAGTNTQLSNYNAAIKCVKRGTLTEVATSGTGAWTLPLNDGDDIVCTITNTDTAKSSITIVKDAVPNSTQDFSFTTTGTGLSNFTLDDDNGVTGADNTNSNTKLFSNLAAGTYSVTEGSQTGWNFDDISCSQGSSVSKNGSTATITLSAGQNVTCTYTNRQRAQIIVHKSTLPANDTTQFSATAGGGGTIYTTTAQTLATNQDAIFSVAQNDSGTAYNVTEATKTGWAQTGNTCTNLVVNGTSTKVTGIPTVECTITNTKLAKLKIVKDAVPNGPQDFVFTTTGSGLSGFTLDDDADSTYSNNQQFTDLLPGSFTISETAVDGWDLTGLVCSGATTYSRPNDGNTLNLTLSPADDATCTFTNTQRGSISGTKYEVDANGQNGVVLGGVTLFNDLDQNDMLDSGEDSTVTANDGTYSFTNLVSGVTYHIREVLQAGWTKIFGGADIALQAGQNSTGNDFGNFHNGTISGYKWNDQNGNGTFDTEPKLAGWTIFIDGNDNGDLNDGETSTVTDQLGSYSFTDLAPGTYSVCEVVQTGWTQTFPGNNACQSAVIDVSGETETRNFGNQGHGTITVKKALVPASDPGKFNLQVDGTTHATDVGDGGTTTAIDVVAGTHGVSELAGTNTDLSDYTTTNACDWNNGARGGEGEGTTQGDLTIAAGDNLVCTFTNTRKTGTLQVLKDVDLNGDGDYTDAGETSATNWQWQANSGDVHNTGDSAITVPTGSYTLSEVAQNNYHFVSLVCTGGTLDGSTVGVAKDAHVVCTFKNARDTGYVKVNKTLYPSNDAGTFNLQVDGQTAGTGANVGDGGTTGLVRVLTGSHSVGETGGTATNLDEYGTTYTCSNDEQGDTTTTANFTVAKDQTVTCTFTNIRLASVTVTKDAKPDQSQPFTFHFGQHVQAESLTQVDSLNTDTSFDLTDDGTHATDSKHFARLLPGTYYLSEDSLSGWDLTDVECGDAEFVQDGSQISFTLQLGQNLSCTFTNIKRASVTIAKDAQPDSSQAFSFTTNANGKDESFSLTDNGTAAATKLFKDLKPGTYAFAEDALNGWDLKSIVCSDGIEVAKSGSSIRVTLAAGDDATCTFTNKKQETGSVLGAMTTAMPLTPTPITPLVQPLVNTGDNIWTTLIVALMSITLTIGASFATRKPHKQ